MLMGTVREYLKLMKNLKNQTDFSTQKVTQGILRTQRFTNQEKKAIRANGHRKSRNQKEKGIVPQWIHKFCFRINS
jgi:hypothetical protein